MRATKAAYATRISMPNQGAGVKGQQDRSDSGNPSALSW